MIKASSANRGNAGTGATGFDIRLKRRVASFWMSAQNKRGRKKRKDEKKQSANVEMARVTF